MIQTQRRNILLSMAKRFILFAAFALPLLAANGLASSHDHEHDGCPLADAAFCETFEVKHPGGRGGDLNESVWSYARSGQGSNPSQGMLNAISRTNAHFCRELVTGLFPPAESFFCGPEFGESQHWMSAQNDNGYSVLSAMIRQPFDFAGRIGTFTMDVDAKTVNGHTWWVEAWLTDEPIPAPHPDTPSSQSFPRHGLGVRFYLDCSSDGRATGVGPEQVVEFRNHQMTLVEFPDDLDCVTAGNDEFNRIQIKVSQSRVEIWATDKRVDHNQPYGPLKLIGSKNLNLGFTRGYWHVQHVQYDPSKGTDFPLCLPGGGSCLRVTESTYHWDNIGFDGPKLPMPRGYSVPDLMQPARDPDHMNLGYLVRSGGMSDADGRAVPPFRIPGVDLTQATGGLVSVLFSECGDHPTIQYRLNSGAWRTAPTPPFAAACANRSVVAPVPLSDLHGGENVLEFRTAAGQETVLSNIDLVVEHNAAPAALTISNIGLSNMSGTGAMISWTTSEAALSMVEYGLTAAYGQMAHHDMAMTAHALALTGLTAGTTYHFRVTAQAGPQSAASPDQTFVTPRTGGAGRPGDMNGDGLVNVTDLSMFLPRFNSADPVADFNHDNTVGVADLSLLLANWTPAGPSAQAFGAPAPSSRLSAALRLIPKARKSAAEPIRVDVFLDSPQPVNAVQASLLYPADRLTLAGVDTSASAFSIGAREDTTAGAVTLIRGSLKPLSGRLKIATLSFQSLAAPFNNNTDPGHAHGAPGAGVFALQFSRSSRALKADDAANLLAKAQPLELSDRVASPLLLSPVPADGINDQIVFDSDVVAVTIVDVNGKKVYEAESLAGASLSWSGRDEKGSLLPSGLYIAKVKKADGGVSYQKLVVAK